MESRSGNVLDRIKAIILRQIYHNNNNNVLYSKLSSGHLVFRGKSLRLYFVLHNIMDTNF